MQGTLNFLLTMEKPVGGPDSMESPTEGLQMLLPEAGAISGGWNGMIASAITFNCQYQPARLFRMLGDQVYAIAGRAELRK